MPLAVPPTNPATGALRYYTSDELDQIGLVPRGVSGEGDHTEESLGPQGAGTPRRFFCNWEERYAAACVLLGAVGTYTNPATGQNAISRLLPDTFAGITGVSGSYTTVWACTSIHMKPFRFTGETDEVSFGQPIPQFGSCDITAQYELIPYQLLDDDEIAPTGSYTELSRYVINPGYPGAEVTSDSKYIGLPGSAMTYATSSGGRPSGIQVPFPVGFPETETRKKLIWARVPEELWGPGTPLTTLIKGNGTTRGYLGAINSAVFLNHPVGTLRLDTVEEQLRADPLGLGYSWWLTFGFTEKAVPGGWTSLYFFENGKGKTSVTPGYYQVTTPNGTTTGTYYSDIGLMPDGTTLFQLRNFNLIFTPGSY